MYVIIVNLLQLVGGKFLYQNTQTSSTELTIKNNFQNHNLMEKVFPQFFKATRTDFIAIIVFIALKISMYFER